MSDEQPQPEPQAVTPGTAILSTATIDSLFAALFATRSADIVAAGTPTYSWATPNTIIAQWPAIQVPAAGVPSQPNYSMMTCTFQSRGVRGSSIAY
jgi:hypothetical protein